MVGGQQCKCHKGNKAEQGDKKYLILTGVEGKSLCGGDI